MTPRRSLTALLVVLATAQPLLAQSGDEGSTPWRRFAFAAVGAALLGGVASLHEEPDAPGASGGVCSSRGCVMAVGSILGAGLGFVLGRELDQRAARAVREGPSLDMDLAGVDLDGSPARIVGTESGIVALTRDAVLLVDDGGSPVTLLEGVQARDAAAAGGTLVLATNRLLLGTGMAGGSPVDTLEEAGAGVLAPAGGGGVAVADLGRLRRLELEGAPGSLSALERETVSMDDLPAAMALGTGGETLWTLEDSLLLGRDPRTLRETGRLVLPGQGRNLSVGGRSGVASLGPAGAVVLNLTDPRSPAVTSTLTGMDYAYDAVAVDGRVYVAAGAQGIFVFDLGSPTEPRPVGVLRDLDFAADLLVHGGRLYVLDREGGRLLWM